MFFLLSSGGFGITMHKCGTSVSFSLNGIPLNKQCTCDHSHAHHHSSCCDDEHEYVKTLDDDFNRVSKLTPPTIDFVALNQIIIELAPAVDNTVTPVAFKPPPERDVSRNTLFCTFLI